MTNLVEFYTERFKPGGDLESEGHAIAGVMLKDLVDAAIAGNTATGAMIVSAITSDRQVAAHVLSIASGMLAAIQTEFDQNV